MAITNNILPTATKLPVNSAALDAPVDFDTNVNLASTNESPDISDAFWTQLPIDTRRFNKLYPYQFLVVRSESGTGDATSFHIEPGWGHTLSLPPEALSTNTPFAISTSATLGGIIEQHNGAPFKMISISGTTGHLPGRDAAVQQLGFSFAQTIAGGTVAQVNRVVGDFKATVASATGTPITNPNVHNESEFEDANALVSATSGYNQMRLLKRFFERYAAIKKTVEGRNLHLAFAAWKDEEVFLVTPTNFSVNRDGSSPFEYKYNIGLKAWRRITLEVSNSLGVLPSPLLRSPNRLAQVLNTLRNARQTVQSITKVAEAAMGDVEHLLFEPLRESILFVKDVMGLGLTVADLPHAIKARVHAAWVEFHGTDTATASGARQTSDRVKNWNTDGRMTANLVASMTSSKNKTAKNKALDLSSSASLFNNKLLGRQAGGLEALDNIDIGVMKLPSVVKQQIAVERSRVRNLTRADFEAKRDTIQNAYNILAVVLGAGNETFEETYGVIATPIKDEPTDTDWDTLNAINDSLIAFDSLAATGDNEPTAREDRIEVMAALNRRSGIAFKIPRSKFAVPFPYGTTLEGLSKTYLGDPDRWPEIVALNGLQVPYIDETGWDVPLLVNGSGAEVVVDADQLSRIYIGQTVYILSRTVRKTQRRVIGIAVHGTSMVLTLDGTANMGQFTTADEAILAAFLPDTVNSQQLIYIPSDKEPSEDGFITKSIPGVSEFDPMVAVCGVDLLLDNHNDLVLTPEGETRYAVGLTNLIQGLRIELGVKRGDLLQHPDYGLPLEVGMSVADFDAKDTLTSVRRMLSSNPAISAINAAQVIQKGPVASINASVSVTGVAQAIPVSFAVDRAFAVSE